MRCTGMLMSWKCWPLYSMDWALLGKRGSISGISLHMSVPGYSSENASLLQAILPLLSNSTQGIAMFVMILPAVVSFSRNMSFMAYLTALL